MRRAHAIGLVEVKAVPGTPRFPFVKVPPRGGLQRAPSNHKGHFGRPVWGPLCPSALATARGPMRAPIVSRGATTRVGGRQPLFPVGPLGRVEGGGDPIRSSGGFLATPFPKFTDMGPFPRPPEGSGGGPQSRGSSSFGPGELGPSATVVASVPPAPAKRPQNRVVWARASGLPVERPLSANSNSRSRPPGVPCAGSVFGPQPGAFRGGQSTGSRRAGFDLPPPAQGGCMERDGLHQSPVLPRRSLPGSIPSVPWRRRWRPPGALAFPRRRFRCRGRCRPRHPQGGGFGFHPPLGVRRRRRAVNGKGTAFGGLSEGQVEVHGDAPALWRRPSRCWRGGRDRAGPLAEHCPMRSSNCPIPPACRRNHDPRILRRPGGVGLRVLPRCRWRLSRLHLFETRFCGGVTFVSVRMELPGQPSIARRISASPASRPTPRPQGSRPLATTLLACCPSRSPPMAAHFRPCVLNEGAGRSAG
ncbi:MAG: hypothetical protein CM15mP128_4520 [Methanobacteriota archaeon]|nr:MAG: hypothetical protein CM15mP128_4520 [Euryarchaeota archaeon]